MSAWLATAARRLRSDQSGFTLVELLVVCLVSIIVVIALFTFQEVVLRGSNRVFAKVDATQRARTTLEQIESRLRSACLSENITPIQAGSTNTKLSFLTRYGSAASLTPEKHEIALNTSTGVLTDTTYAVTGGTAPNWTFSSTGTSRRLLDHVAQVPGVPLFRYYAYGIARDSSNQPYLDAAGNTVHDAARRDQHPADRDHDERRGQRVGEHDPGQLAAARCRHPRPRLGCRSPRRSSPPRS